ncbi:hypothetical protein [Bacillus bombysepticus]|uniref:hypothetical protein n=1 Tax=Bacillus bombysepticus TaxID=658666 RepID=UPI00301861F7
MLLYTKQAIDYWYDGCDSEEEIKQENDSYKLICSRYINTFNMYQEDTYTAIGDEYAELKGLLSYSQEAIDYWFSGCDAEQRLIDENDFFKEKCKVYINLFFQNQSA